MSELEFKHSYRRNLPHYQPLGGTFFITSCLSGSLPKSIIDSYKREKQRFVAQSRALPVSERAKQELGLQRQWFLKIEGVLHKAETGPTWLNAERVAKIVKDAMHFYDGKRYRLDAYCVMPNHFHLVLAPLPITEWDETKALTDNLRDTERYYLLSKIMHSIKSHTSKEANKVLGRGGTFWQAENYDRAIRDQPGWERTVAYVINNPVKAGLVTNWEDWPHTYLRPMERRHLVCVSSPAQRFKTIDAFDRPTQTRCLCYMDQTPLSAPSYARSICAKSSSEKTKFSYRLGSILSYPSTCPDAASWRRPRSFHISSNLIVA